MDIPSGKTLDWIAELEKYENARPCQTDAKVNMYQEVDKVRISNERNNLELFGVKTCGACRKNGDILHPFRQSANYCVEIRESHSFHPIADVTDAPTKWTVVD